MADHPDFHPHNAWKKKHKTGGKSKDPTPPAIVIKKYANRRLYNTATSTYVTLSDLAVMVKEGVDFVVYDAKTSEDLTRTVLTQIIFEEESKGVNLLPIPFLRQLIGFYGDKLQAFIPNYLEFSLESLRKEQERFQRQVMESFASDQLKAIEEQARTNITLFQEALQVFNPFSALVQHEKQVENGPQHIDKKEEKKEGAQEDLDAIRAEMAALRRELGAIRREKP